MSRIYFQNDFGVKVDSSCIHDGQGGVYQLRNINSVRTIYFDVPKYGPLLKWIVGGLFGSFVVSLIVLSSTNNKTYYLTSLLACFFGTGFRAYQLFKRPSRIYQVKLSTSSGEIDSFTSYEQEGPHQIAQAITKAMSDLAA